MSFYEIPGETMGTTYSIKYVVHNESDFEFDYGDELEAILAEINALMSTYQPDSELSRFNKADAQEPFPLDVNTAMVFKIALQVSEQTGGAFDITVGPLVNAYGFGPDGIDKVPSDEQREQLLQQVGYNKVQLDFQEKTVTKSQADVYCDLSAVAKGYAVDALTNTLLKKGVQQAMVEVGGEVRTIGLNQGMQPWRIGIERPTQGVRDLQQVVPLSDKAMATSGDYRNFRMVYGKRISHTIDPRTGKPIDHSLASVSVVHDSCAWADAYATALMVLGPEEGLAFAEEHQLAVLFLVHEEEDTFKEITTPQFEALLN